MAQNTLQGMPSYATAPWALAMVALEAALAQYGPAAYAGTFNLTPTVQARIGLASIADAEEAVGGCEALGSALGATVDALSALTINRNLGLVHVGPGAYAGWRPPQRADAFLNFAVCFCSAVQPYVHCVGGHSNCQLHLHPVKACEWHIFFRAICQSIYIV
jgi:hypothetical protein